MLRRDQLEEMLKANPDDSFLRYAIALECNKQGQPEEAIARLRDLIRCDPDYVAAYFQTAQILAEQGESEAAREIVRLGIDAARRIGDTHAAREMTEFLEML